MSVEDLKTKRRAAGITGDAIRQITGIDPTKLSRLERGSLSPAPGELECLSGAIEKIIRNKQKIVEFARNNEISLVGVAL